MKIFIVLLLSLYLFIPSNLLSNPLVKQKLYNHNFYSQELGKNIYPFIKEHLKQYNHNLEKDEAKKIVDEIQNKVSEYFNKKGILICLNTTILTLENKLHVAYLLEVSITFCDSDESTEIFITNMIYVKRF